MTGRAWLNEARARLAENAIESPALEARWMLADALEVEPGRLWAVWDRVLTDAQLARLTEWLDLRASGMPLQYAQGYQVFMDEQFLVNASVLIPRQDTQVLCTCAIERVGQQSADVLDLCTGSGVLAVMIAKRCPNARVTATDISIDALEVARENARKHRVAIEWLTGDFLESVAQRSFDLIVCNPPYLTETDMLELQREVGYEPALALFGGADGLTFYRRARSIREYLRAGGAAYFEVGAGQAQDVAELLGASRVIPDWSGIERVVEILR